MKQQAKILSCSKVIENKHLFSVYYYVQFSREKSMPNTLQEIEWRHKNQSFSLCLRYKYAIASTHELCGVLGRFCSGFSILNHLIVLLVHVRHSFTVQRPAMVLATHGNGSLSENLMESICYE